MQGSSLVPQGADFSTQKATVFVGDILRFKQLRQICSTVNLMNLHSNKKKKNESFHTLNEIRSVRIMQV
jgi:hypothetical protein